MKDDPNAGERDAREDLYFLHQQNQDLTRFRTAQVGCFSALGGGVLGSVVCVLYYYRRIQGEPNDMLWLEALGVIPIWGIIGAFAAGVVGVLVARRLGARRY